MFKLNGIFTFLLLCISACTNKIDKKEQINYTTIQNKQEIRLIDNQEEPVGCIDIDITTIDTCTFTAVAHNINKTIAEELFHQNTTDLTKAITIYVQNYLDNYKNTCRSLYLEDKKKGIPDEWYEYHYTIKGEAVSEARSNTINYQFICSRKEGGATEALETKTFCFDSKSGNRLALDSLFHSNCQERLNALLKDDLLKQFDCTSEKELSEKGIAHFTGIYTPNNFILTDKGILFLYNPHEIAPYEQGIISCLIDYDDLKEWLKPQYN